jgi:hypothetical protein
MPANADMIYSFMRSAFGLKFPVIMTIVDLLCITLSLLTLNRMLLQNIFVLLEKIFILKFTVFSCLAISVLLLLTGGEVCYLTKLIIIQNEEVMQFTPQPVS